MKHKDNMTSLVFADSIINTVLDKVSHIKYMEAIDEKVRPFTVIQTTLQGLRVLELNEFQPDRRKDDIYLTAE